MLGQNLLLAVSALAAAVSASPLQKRQEERVGGGRPGNGGRPGQPGRPTPTLLPAPGPPVSILPIGATTAATDPSATAAPEVPATTTDGVDPGATAGPVLPTVPGAAAQLPSPPEDQQVFFIGLGHGIQNYTCATAGGAATAVGALAVLYDITELAPGSGSGALDQATFDGLSSSILSSPLPLNLAEGSAATNTPFPEADDTQLGGRTLSFLGRHYFNAAGVPTFDLAEGSDDNELFLGSKTGAIPAPDPVAAVAWLQLTAIAGSRGVQTIYRVVTAGGNPTTCESAGQQISVPYAAQYWFFDWIREESTDLAGHAASLGRGGWIKNDKLECS